MSQKPVFTIEDLTNVALEERRPGCKKGMLHEDAPVQTALYRVHPGSGVPTHLHARVYDLFVGVKGNLEIRYEDQHGNGVFVLKPGAFCRMPPGVRHELSNPSKTDETVFLLVQASQEGFDYVPAPFRTIEPGPCSRRDTMKNFFPGLQRIMAELSDADRELAWTEVEQQLNRFEGSNGFEAPRRGADWRRNEIGNFPILTSSSVVSKKVCDGLQGTMRGYPRLVLPSSTHRP